MKVTFDLEEIGDIVRKGAEHAVKDKGLYADEITCEYREGMLLSITVSMVEKIES